MLHAKFKIIGLPVLEKKIFTHYGRGSHLGHVTWTIYINFRSPFPRRLHVKFGFDWPSRFRGEYCNCIRIFDCRLESTTLHAKFQNHRTSGFGEEDFQRFLPYMGVAAI